MNLEYLEEELNTSVDWGRGKIKVGLGVGNSFRGQCQRQASLLLGGSNFYFVFNQSQLSLL